MMVSMAVILDETLKILSFMGVQYALGKRVSFPYGLLLHFSLLKIAFLVVLCDFIQALLLLNFLETGFEKIKWLKKLKVRMETRKQNRKKESLFTKLSRRGHWGLLLAASLPYGGGALTGSLLAFSMQMDKRKAFIYIMLGCIFGTLLFYHGFRGLHALL